MKVDIRYESREGTLNESGINIFLIILDSWNKFKNQRSALPKMSCRAFEVEASLLKYSKAIRNTLLDMNVYGDNNDIDSLTNNKILN